MKLPSVRAHVTLRSDLGNPRWPNRARYMPHIVLGNPAQREPRISGRTIDERYLGVLIADAPDEIAPGDSAEITLGLIYWPEEHYEGVVPDATFTIREGPKIVGFGRVLSEISSPAEQRPDGLP